MLRTSGILLVLCALLGAMQAHLAIFQLAAWTKMLPEYRQSTESWVEAAKDTFDANKRCDWCLVIDESIDYSSKENKRAPSVDQEIKLLIPSSKEWLPRPHPKLSDTSTSNRFGIYKKEAPSVPPPRLFV